MNRWLAALGRTSRVASALVVCALFLAACASTEPKPQWSTDKVRASSDRVLREVTRVAMEKTGFPSGAGLDQATLVATSGWMTSLAPFRGKGYREQCEVHYKALGGGEYQVDVRVRRQKNDDLLRPLDLTYAQWEPEPDNAERAKIVVEYLKALLNESRPRTP